MHNKVAINILEAIIIHKHISQTNNHIDITIRIIITTVLDNI